MLKDALDLAAIHRVLVIKLRHHGDVLLTSPVFSVLKNHAPHLEIDALVYRDTADMLSLHPAIARIHTVDRQWKDSGPLGQAKAEWALLSALRERRYDLIVHLTESNRGAWIKRLTGARYGVARSLNSKGKFWRRSFSHFFPYPRGNSRHTVEIHLDALRRLGIYPAADERRLTLVPGAAAEESVSVLLRQHQVAEGNFIHIHPTSRWLFKCWTVPALARLIDTLGGEGHTVVLSAAPAADEMAWMRRLQGSLTHPVVDFSGQLNLKQLAALTARAKLFVGMDSVPMHIAAAMGTPTVALFGPSGDIEWGPWQTPHRIVTSGHPCRPCGQDGCGGGKISECLTDIPAKQVLAAIQELLT
ncbi:MAG: putative lipopolysaccharide heptosyltransferase III [Burkholderiales bacterium]